MFFSPGVNVVFGISDVSDLIFEACAEFMERNAFSHWLRSEPLDRLPKIPKLLEEDPIRLKHIIFYYEKPSNPRKAAELAIANRQRGDIIIVEYPSITDRFRLATLLALLSDYENVGNTSIIILPESEDLQLTATQFTKNLWKIDVFGSLQKL